jgi:membrane protein DedA with SNARE-associated domain
LLERRGRWFHLSGDKLDRAERWFDRWDSYAVFIGRITPVIRSFISIPAGVFRMPFAPYVVLTAIGSAIWAFAFAGIGWAAGQSYERVHHDFGYVEYLVVAAILVLLVFWIVRRRRSPKPGPGVQERSRP